MRAEPTTADQSERTSFSVRVRWQAEADCAWEVETHHGGFASAEEAALFANGLADVAIVDLRLERGKLRLGFTDGSWTMMHPEAVTIWTLAKEAAAKRTAADTDFSKTDIPISTLSRHGLDGAFLPLAYGVLGPDRQPVDVRILLDEDLGTVDVRVSDDPPNDNDQGLLLFGLIPRA